MGKDGQDKFEQSLDEIRNSFVVRQRRDMAAFDRFVVDDDRVSK